MTKARKIEDTVFLCDGDSSETKRVAESLRNAAETIDEFEWSTAPAPKRNWGEIQCQLLDMAEHLETRYVATEDDIREYLVENFEVETGKQLPEEFEVNVYN